jgi:DNA polymerase III epsilon subunit-like protein
MSPRGTVSLPLDAVQYAVVDVETTGFSPRLGDRVVEIALVRMTPDGTIEDEFATLVDPECDVGPTHVHGIRASDLVGAPRFADIVGDVAARTARSVLVANNPRFDRRKRNLREDS